MATNHVFFSGGEKGSNAYIFCEEKEEIWSTYLGMQPNRVQTTWQDLQNT